MTPPAHIGRVLAALAEIGTEATQNGDPTLWFAACPACPGELLVRDVDWNERTGERKAKLFCPSHADDREILKALGLRECDLFFLSDQDPSGSGATDAPKPNAVSTWAPVPLQAVLDGEHTDPTPTMLARTDGRCLIYPARVHALHAEPEALKTWCALAASGERLAAGEAVMYIDCEDSARGVVGRAQALGVGASAIAERFIYIRPDEPLAAGALEDLDGALSQYRPSLAVIDGVTEAFSRQGLSPLDNSDVATWLDLLPRRLVRAGAAVLLLDHVVKDREQRGRYALGAQHKLAGCDVAYSLRVIEPFGHGREGEVAIKVEKDRPGRVREFASDGHVAMLRAKSDGDGGVTIALEPPERAGDVFRPTVLMERVSLAVEGTPGLSKRALREAVKGKATLIDLALEFLVADGFVDVQQDGQATRHFSKKPYRHEDGVSRVSRVSRVSQPCPDTPESDRVPCPDPLGEGRGNGPSCGDTQLASVSRPGAPIEAQTDEGALTRLEREQGMFDLGAGHIADLLGVDVASVTTEPDAGGLKLSRLLEAFAGEAA